MLEDGAEDISGGGALIAMSARAGAARCPAAGDLVLLADPSLVLEPNPRCVRLWFLRRRLQLGGSRVSPRCRAVEGALRVKPSQSIEDACHRAVTRVTRRLSGQRKSTIAS